MIRAAQPSDADAVAVVHETARNAYHEAARGRPIDARARHDADEERLAMWQMVLRDPARATVLCAEVGERVVAFLSVGPPMHEHPEDPEVLELHALYVLPAHWAFGIGSQLHGAFVGRLAAGPAARGILDVWSRNTRAIAFYERKGWVADGRSRPGADGAGYDGMSLTLVQ